MTRNEEIDRHTMQRMAVALEQIADRMDRIYMLAMQEREKEAEDDSGEAD
jgi:hypothetical protein